MSAINSAIAMINAGLAQQQQGMQALAAALGAPADSAPSVPRITSPPSAAFTVGQTESFTVTATGYPAPTVTIAGTPPPGLSFLQTVPGYSEITGTATDAGAFNLSINAANSVGSTGQAFTLVIRPSGT
jgi:hypothetical protein